MTEIQINDPCVLFALARESMAFRRTFQYQQAIPNTPCPAWFSGPSWLTVVGIETGVGAENCRRAVEWVLSRPLLEGVPYRPKVLIFAGFAGALEPGWKVGDIQLAREVVAESGGSWPTTWPGPIPADWKDPPRQGRIVTVDRLIGDPREKAGLQEKYDAQCVDMESATFARLCHSRGVPFACLRVVSDTAEQPVSRDVFELLEGGRVHPGKLAWALLKRPRLIGELMRLRRDTNLAAENLAHALGELLTMTLDWMD